MESMDTVLPAISLWFRYLRARRPVSLPPFAADPEGWNGQLAKDRPSGVCN